MNARSRNLGRRVRLHTRQKKSPHLSISLFAKRLLADMTINQRQF